MSYQALMQWFGDNPTVGLLLVLILCFLMTALLLAHSVRRYRDEVVGRLAECEDAHLERDKIQLDLVTLMAEQVGAIGRHPSRAEVVSDFSERADQIVAGIHALNAKMLGRRERERVARERKNKFSILKVKIEGIT